MASECKIMYTRGKKRVYCCTLHSAKLTVSTQARESTTTLDTSVLTSQCEVADKVRENGEVARRIGDK